MYNYRWIYFKYGKHNFSRSSLPSFYWTSCVFAEIRGERAKDNTGGLNLSTQALTDGSIGLVSNEVNGDSHIGASFHHTGRGTATRDGNVGDLHVTRT